MRTDVYFSTLLSCLLACSALMLHTTLPPSLHQLFTLPRLADQEFLHRTLVENQKLSLMGEVSYLKVKLADMEEKQSYGVDRQHKAEVRTFYSAVSVKLLHFNTRQLSLTAFQSNIFLNERSWEQVDDDVIAESLFSYNVQDFVRPLVNVRLANCTQN